MSAQLIRWESWALSEEADRRFRKICAAVGVPAIILAVLLSIFQMEVKKTPPGAYNGSRYAELVAEEQGVTAPAPEEPKPAEKNTNEKPQEAPKPVQKPTPVPTQTAREAAQKTQEMRAIQDQLADLRDQNLNPITSQTPLMSGVIASKGGAGGALSADAISASAAANSGGGIGGTGSVTSSQSGTGLGTRRTGSVQSPVGFGRDPRVGLNGEHGGGSRTPSEIQEVFDRNKGALIAIYNRELRENPNIGDGKLIVNLTIAPDGSVTQCSVVSSTFNDPEFEHKLVQRIMLIRFQAKNVPVYTLPRYPIEIHPM